MSVLSIIQSHCKLHALSVPTSVIGSTDTQTVQLLEILRNVLEELVTQSDFNVTTQEAVFSPIAQMDQGLVSDIATNGYQSIIIGTLYDRTLRLPLLGPMTEQEWQQQQALPSASTRFFFRIRQDHLLLWPIPSPPFSDMAFEYNSSWAVQSNAGVLQSDIIADTDTFLFPENILKRGMTFRWKQTKGLPYQADETAFYGLLNNYIAKDKVKRDINVGMPEDANLAPGIMIPTNSWPVSN